MGETVGVNDLPDGMPDDAPAPRPPRELIETFLGNFPHDFEWRPGETIEVDGEDAQREARHFRDVLGRYASGVTVVTTMTADGPKGMTCQSFTSVSLDPPLVAFLPTKQSRAGAAIQGSGTFCVNFLAADQHAISDQFASSGGDKFDGVDHAPSIGTGSPVLAGTVGHVDCSVDAVHDAGDHFLVIGRVVGLDIGEAEEPLVYYRGAYRG